METFHLVYTCFSVEEREEKATLFAAAQQLRSALAEYVVLGPGRCTIGKPAFERGMAALLASKLEPTP